MKKLSFLFISILIIVILLLLLLFLWFKKYKESFDNSPKKNAFCLLTETPHPIWMEFLENHKSKTYDCYVLVDKDISEQIDELNRQYPNVKCVWIPDNVCTDANYTNSDYVFKPIVATDRAYYYFTRERPEYDNVWFVENDVWFRSMDDLELLDRKYPDSDFIVTDIEDFDSTREWPHWVQIEGRLDKPWGHYIVCVCRISRKLLNEMDNLVKKQGKLIFKEIMFHTLAIHNNMKIDTPPEIKNITIRHYPLDYSKYQKGHFYHSIKDMNLHKLYRTDFTE